MFIEFDVDCVRVGGHRLAIEPGDTVRDFHARAERDDPAGLGLLLRVLADLQVAMEQH